MKIDFQAPVAIAAMESGGDAPEQQSRPHFFAPLSVFTIYENRIDVTLKGEISSTRSFRYKRFDEAVN